MIFDETAERLEMEAAQAANQAIDDVKEALEGADVDIEERKIIWADGERLSIDETAEKIKRSSESDIERLKRNTMAWMQMDHVPKGLTRKEHDRHNYEIEKWIEEDQGRRYCTPGYPSFFKN